MSGDPVEVARERIKTTPHGIITYCPKCDGKRLFKPVGAKTTGLHQCQECFLLVVVTN